MTWYLSDFWAVYKRFWRTKRRKEIVWAWACSKEQVIGGGTRRVPKEVLVRYALRELRSKHGMEIDKLLANHR